MINDETIDYVGILAKLELSGQEKEQAKKDMGKMLGFIDKLNELDTTGIEPMSHITKVQNVFREDMVTNGDESEKTLKNAPGKKDNMFMVPKTVDYGDKHGYLIIYRGGTSESHQRRQSDCNRGHAGCLNKDRGSGKHNPCLCNDR